MAKNGTHHLDYLTDIYRPFGESPNLLRVLTYHRVGYPQETPELEPRQISATTGDFDQQMRFLAEHYRVVSMAEVLEAVETGKRLPERAVLITFDDACCDVKENAWPILQRYGLPATVFVPTAYPDHPERLFWWDRLYQAVIFTRHSALPDSPIGPLSLDSTENRRRHLKELQNHLKTLSHREAGATVDELVERLEGTLKSRKTVLSWEELRQLAREGMTLGAHTRTHPILTRIPLAEVREEVGGALRDLRREIGDVLPVFAYPNGNHSEEIINILKEEGFRLAFVTRDGFNNLNTVNPFAVRRVNITRRTSPKLFRLRMQKWFSYIDVKRHSA